MIRNHKIGSLMLAGVLAIGSLAACSSPANNEGSGKSGASHSQPSSGDASNAATKDPYEIVLAMPAVGAVPKDIQAVQDAISKIAQEKINATVKLQVISVGSWEQQMNLMTSSGEKLDLFFTFGQSYIPYAGQGKIIELDALLDKQGQELKKEFDPEYLMSAKVDGKLYGVPSLKDYTTGVPGILMRKDLVEKHKIDVTSIKSIHDLDPVFKTIKDNEPNMAPLGVGLSVPSDKYVWYDKLGDRFGVLPEFDNGRKIVNLFETKEYGDFLYMMHGWFKAGYINKDAATSKNSVQEMVKANKAFSYISSIKVGGVERESRNTGNELVFAPLLPTNYSTTSDVLLGLWTISKNSADPERVMEFMNLMYTDKDMVNLMKWGVEGKHYVKLSDNTIEYPSGVDSKSVGYSNQNFLTPNSFLTYVFKGDSPDVWKRTAEENQQAIKSKALGFNFNSNPVKNEITALNNVVDQYVKGLESGVLDPAQRLPEFIAKLKAAGMDKVIAEKQKQLDAWAAANKK
jgi:putative aldouronate transport system substrate-binding protein